jgi:hypothetical protein
MTSSADWQTRAFPDFAYPRIHSNPLPVSVFLPSLVNYRAIIKLSLMRASCLSLVVRGCYPLIRKKKKKIDNLSYKENAQTCWTEKPA